MFLLKTKFIVILITALFGAVILCMVSCDNKSALDDLSEDKLVIKNDEFSVNFLHLSSGDCTVVNFGDGKVLMIDSGETNCDDYDVIKDCLESSNITKIDYFVVSHVSAIGNLDKIAHDFALGEVFIPKINKTERFEKYNQILSDIKGKVENFYDVAIGNLRASNDYFFTFLSPATEGKISMTDDLDFGEITQTKIEFSSAVIYLEYKGKKFVFGGDANSSALDKIIEFDDVGLYGVLGKYKVDLNNVDVFKLPKHGDKDCVSEELFYKLKAKIGVVTTPMIDANGYPDSFSLTTLVKANPNVKTLRTDVEGNISITLDTDGNIKIK